MDSLTSMGYIRWQSSKPIHIAENRSSMPQILSVFVIKISPAGPVFSPGARCGCDNRSAFCGLHPTACEKR